MTYCRNDKYCTLPQNIGVTLSAYTPSDKKLIQCMSLSYQCFPRTGNNLFLRKGATDLKAIKLSRCSKVDLHVTDVLGQRDVCDKNKNFSPFLHDCWWKPEETVFLFSFNLCQ